MQSIQKISLIKELQVEQEERKKAQKSISTLANRLVLLKQEELKFWKRIKDAKKRAIKTINQRKEFFQDKNMIQQKKTEERQKLLESIEQIKLKNKESRIKNKELFLKRKNQILEQNKQLRLNIKKSLEQKYSKEKKISNDQQEKIKTSYQEIKVDKVEEFKKMKIKKVRQQLKENIGVEKQRKRKILKSIDEMVNMENLLIDRLKKQQDKQDKIFQILNDASQKPIKSLLKEESKIKMELNDIVRKGKNKKYRLPNIVTDVSNKFKLLSK